MNLRTNHEISITDISSSYLHLEQNPPATLFILKNLSLPTDLLRDYELSSGAFKRHQRKLHIILFRKELNHPYDLHSWPDRFSWLEKRTAPGYKHIRGIIKDCREEEDKTAISWMSHAIEYIHMIQDDVSVPLQRRLQYYYQ
jgi:hypothetical protein